MNVTCEKCGREMVQGRTTRYSPDPSRFATQVSTHWTCGCGWAINTSTWRGTDAERAETEARNWIAQN